MDFLIFVACLALYVAIGVVVSAVSLREIVDEPLDRENRETLAMIAAFAAIMWPVVVTVALFRAVGLLVVFCAGKRKPKE